MFSFGNKLRVLNVDSDVVVLDDAGAARATSAAITLGTDRLSIAGFGNFPIVAISDMKMKRAMAPVNHSITYACAAPAGLAVGDALAINVYLKTSRYQSELKNNFIGAARPVSISTLPLTGTTASDIATAIEAAFTAFASQFHNADLPISATASTNDIVIATTAGYESVTIDKLTITRANQGIGTQAPLALVAGTTVLGHEGRGQGKFLEESIRLGTLGNVDVYGNDNEGVMVDLRASYTEVYFKLDMAYGAGISGTGAADTNLTGTHEYTLFLNEATMLAADGAISDLSAIAILAAGANAGMTLTDQTAPLTNAQESTETLFLADGTTVDDTVAFIA